MPAIAEFRLGERNWIKAVCTVVMLLYSEFTGNNNTFMCYHHVTFITWLNRVRVSRMRCLSHYKRKDRITLQPWLFRSITVCLRHSSVRYTCFQLPIYILFTSRNCKMAHSVYVTDAACKIRRERSLLFLWRCYFCVDTVSVIWIFRFCSLFIEVWTGLIIVLLLSIRRSAQCVCKLRLAKNRLYSRWCWELLIIRPFSS